MVNDFMKNLNKANLNGEVVSFSDLSPKVDNEEVKVEVVEEKPSKKGKKAKVEEPVVETETKDEVVEEKIAEEKEEDEE